LGHSSVLKKEDTINILHPIRRTTITFDHTHDDRFLRRNVYWTPIKIQDCPVC
jgi:hypothetical protein